MQNIRDQSVVALLTALSLVSVTSAVDHDTQVNFGGLSAHPRKLRQHAEQPANSTSKTPLDDVLSRYFSNEELLKHMRGFAKRCNAIAELRSIGKSVEGRELWALQLGSDVGNPRPQPRPAFRYVANMHGNEPSGRQLLLGLAEWLCARHSSDPRAAAVLDGMQLHLLPSMNPDGYAVNKRENSNGIDLNRDFPDPVGRRQGPLPAAGTEQPETLALMAWARSRIFTASADLHEGALVANYPWDANDAGESGYAKSPDDATFRFLASTYANAHATMGSAGDGAEFPDGITNGADWYPVYGGMQDWIYVETQCMELTLEVSQNKQPPADTLQQLFVDNLGAMLALPVAALFSGVRGYVHGEPGTPVAANITVEGVASAVLSSAAAGDFYRPLAPGQYTLKASSPGFHPASASIVVPEDGTGTWHNFTLTPGGSTAKSGGDTSVSSSSDSTLPDAVDMAAANSGALKSGSPWLRGKGSLLTGRQDSVNSVVRACAWAAAAAAIVAFLIWVVRQRTRRRRGWAQD